MRLFIGETGAGKDNFVNTEALQIIREREKYLTMALPHPTDWQRLLGEMYAEHGDDMFNWTTVDRIQDTDLVLMSEIIHVSRASDYWQREDENEGNAWLVVEMAAARRNMPGFEDHPVLEKGALLLPRIKQSLPRWISDSRVHWAFRPLSPTWKLCLETTTKSDIRYELESFQHFSRKERMSELEPIFRTFQSLVGTGAVARRTSRPPTCDKRSHLNQAGVHLICGNGTSRDAFRTLVLADFADTVFLAHAGLEREGVYYINELVNYRLGNDFYARTLATSRYTGLDNWASVQSLNFPTPEITDSVLQNCDLYIGRCTNPKLADLMALALRGAYDRHKVHHEEETVKFDPYVHHEQRVTHGWSGHRLSEATINTSTTEVPVVHHEKRIETRPVYESGDAQAFWQAADLQEAPVGTFWVKRKGARPYRVKVPLLPDSWVFPGLAEEKVEECIAKLKAFRTDLYQRPVLPRETTASVSNGKTTVPANGTCNGSHGRKGMS